MKAFISIILITCSLFPRLVTAESKSIITSQEQKHKVYLFTQTFCPSCLYMKKYFKENHINFVELDIETNQQAKAAFDRIKGRGTPMIVINKKIAYGVDITFVENNLYK